MEPFSWNCPYCNHDAIITGSNYSEDTHYFDKNNKDGFLCIVTRVIVCPNGECREYAVRIDVCKAFHDQRQNLQHANKSLLFWQLKPQSQAKAYSSYTPKVIPKVIIDDYNEACLIRDLSPKASATLSRRCLQGIIRDFWGISKGRLIDEINELQGKTDPATWDAIDAVRSIGNIGAHMEKDINVIVEVEPEEAGLLIGLIEILLKDWYIAKHDREEHLKKIVAAAEKKQEDKQV